MAFAQNSRSELVYVTETSFGTTPATPSMKRLPIKSHTLTMAKGLLEGNDIRPDRLNPVERHGDRTVSGDIVTDFRADDLDDLLESAFFNTFSTGVLKIGTTPKFLTLEDAALDIAQYQVYTGCAVSRMTMRVTKQGMVECTFGMVGKNRSISGTALDGTVDDYTNTQPVDSYTGSIQEGGSSIATITDFEMVLENSIEPTSVIGTDVTPQLEYGDARVSLNVTAYFEDASLVNKFDAETESSMQIVLDDPFGSTTYTFDFPRTKINGAATPVSGRTGSRMMTLPMTALRDDTEETNVKITKA